MTQEEFENLKFGDIIFNANNDRYVFIKDFDDRFIIVDECDCSISEVQIGSYLRFSLTPQKKKVDRECIRYGSDDFIRELDKGLDIQGRLLNTKQNKLFNNKIIITYETEE